MSVGTAQLTIGGIQCRLQSRAVRCAIGLVLARIRQCAPSDFQRIRQRVTRFVPLTRAEERDGTTGEWRVTPLSAKDREPRGGEGWQEYGLRIDRHPYSGTGIVKLTEATGDHAVALVAHELGHVCTREEDLQRRCPDFRDSEWASELSADWYAYKWGFGREIARGRKRRRLAHHGPGPGQIVEMFGARARVTRRFVLRTLGR